MKKYISGLIICLMLSLCFSINTVSSETIKITSTGNTLYVGGTGDGNYTTIQDAIDNASDGDTVFVYNGVYNESIRIETANISLIGENKELTIIDRNWQDYGVSLHENGFYMFNFTIMNSSFGIILSKSDITLENNIIKFNDIGIVCCFSSKNRTIEMNDISYNSIGIQLDFGGGNLVTNNTISNNEVGIKIGRGGSSNKIIRNNITNNILGFTSEKDWGSPRPWIFDVNNDFHQNNFIDNEKVEYFYRNKIKNWENNYWSDWIGLKNNIFSFIPKRINGLPYKWGGLCSYIWGFNLDLHPAKEPFDINAGC